jgi:hypothetical protein
MSFSRIVVIASICLGLTAAVAQQREATSTACNANSRGTVNCPTYTAPATTALPRSAMDGSMNVPAQTAVTLFNGTVPPNGFMVLPGPNTGYCAVNDNGPASAEGLAVTGGGYSGFVVSPATLPGFSPIITPPGYKPMGAISVWCTTAGYVAARGW